MSEWIKKKEKPKAWISKKEKPKAWISKKEKPKTWISKKKTVDPKKTLRSAGIEAKIESAKDKVTPLKSDRVTGRGEKKVTFKPGEGASLSNRGTTGSNWRAGKDRVEKWFTSGDAAKNYKKTGKLFTNYSGKMKKGGRAGFKHGNWVSKPNPHIDMFQYVDKKTGKEVDDGKVGKTKTIKGSEMKSNKRSIDRAPREHQYGRKGKKKKAMKKFQLGKKYNIGGRASYNSGGAVLKGKKVGCQIK